MIHLERKQQIINIALGIAKNNGWDDVTMRTISSKLKLSLPIIYKYFDNKDEILFEVVKISVDEIIQKITFIKINSSNPLEDCLTELFNYFTLKAYIFNYIFDKDTFETIVYKKNILEILQNILDASVEFDTKPSSSAILAQLVGQLHMKTTYPELNFEDIKAHIKKESLAK